MLLSLYFIFFFLFKQKTAYEMRISDWSSDVCSSDPSVRLDTQHEATATIVHAAQGKLVEDLRQQGVRVAGAEVTCTPNETGRQSQGQGRAPAPSAAHLIETGDARPASPGEAGAADRRGRFA